MSFRLFSLLSMLIPALCMAAPRALPCNQYQTGNVSAVEYDSMGSPRYSKNGQRVALRRPDGSIVVVDTTNGNQKVIKPDAGEEFTNFELSPDGSRLVLAGAGNSGYIHELATGRVEEIELYAGRSQRTQVYFSPDGKSVAFVPSGAGGNAVIRQFALSKNRVVNLTQNVPSLGMILNTQVTGDGNLVLMGESDVVHFDSKKWKFSTLPHKRHQANSFNLSKVAVPPIVSPDGKSVLTIGADDQFRINDLDTGKQVLLPGRLSDSVQPTFSPDGRYLARTIRGGTFILSDRKTGRERVIASDRRVHRVRFSADGRRMLSILDGGSIMLTEVASGSSREISRVMKRPLTVEFNPKDSNKILIHGPADAVTFDLSSGQSTPHLFDGRMIMDARYSADGQHAVLDTTSTEFTDSTKSAIMIASAPGAVCLSNHLKVQALPCNAALEEPNGKLVEPLVLPLACKTPFNAGLWDRQTSLIQSGTLSVEQARKWLLRFQKPGGFDPKKHLSILNAILESDFRRDEPDLVLGALQGVLASSNLLYDQIMTVDRALKRQPSLESLVPRNSEKSSSCRTEDEQTQLALSAQKHVQYLALKGRFPGTLNEWQSIKPLTPLFSRLKPEDRRELIHLVATNYRSAARFYDGFAGVRGNLIEKFAEQAVAPLFGEKTGLLVERELVSNNDWAESVMLSTVPKSIYSGEDFEPTPFGFYMKRYGKVYSDDKPERDNHFNDADQLKDVGPAIGHLPHAERLPLDKKAFCTRTSEMILFDAALPDSRIAFKNPKGPLGKGMCWFHTRFQRSALYLANFQPAKAKPSPSEARKLLRSLVLMEEVVEIPGYKNIYEFTKDYQNEIESLFTKWSFAELPLLAKRLGDASPTSSEDLQQKMDHLYRRFLDRPELVYLRTKAKSSDLVEKAFYSHAWLVRDIRPIREKSTTDSTAVTRHTGYRMEIIDSNLPDHTITIDYTIGDTSLKIDTKDDEAENNVIYEDFDQDLVTQRQALRNYCRP